MMNYETMLWVSLHVGGAIGLIMEGWCMFHSLFSSSPSSLSSLSSSASVCVMMMVGVMVRVLIVSMIHHRYLSHGSYWITSRVVQIIAALAASATGHGSPWRWANIHRHFHTAHHRHSGVRESANASGGLTCTKCEVRWRDLFGHHLSLPSSSTVGTMTDTSSSSICSSTTNHHNIWILMDQKPWLVWMVWLFVQVIIVRQWDNVIRGVIWGVCISQVLVWHLTAVIHDHSLAALFGGTKRWLNKAHGSNACNNWLVALMTCGDGWYDNHHSLPTCEQFGLAWYEYDPSYRMIQLLQLLKLATRLPHDQSRRSPSLNTGSDNRIYYGQVHHTRLTPFYNRFTYGVFYPFVELNDDTPHAFDNYWLWSSNGSKRGWAAALTYPKIATFRVDDYLDHSKVKEIVFAQTGRVVHRVFLLTNWRYWGYTFNPISYYFCFGEPSASSASDATDPLGPLVCMVNEVHNTPWNEKIHYVHPANLLRDLAAPAAAIADTAASAPILTVKKVKASHRPNALIFHDATRKMMHVSPFMQMEYEYIFDWGIPTMDGWDVRFELRHIPQPMTKLQWDERGVVSVDDKESKSINPTTASPSSSLSSRTIDAEPVTRHVVASMCPCAASTKKDTPLPKGHLPITDTRSSVSSLPALPHGSSMIDRNNIHMKVSMSLSCRAVNGESLLWILYRYPAMTLKVTLGIYWEALLLYAHRGATLFNHPNPKLRWGK